MYQQISLQEMSNIVQELKSNPPEYFVNQSDIKSIIGGFVDSSFYLKDSEAMNQCISILKLIIEQEQNHIPELYYFLGNAYSDLLHLDGKTKKFLWNDEIYANILLNYRMALKDSEQLSIDKVTKCRIYTNLGNFFNRVGRPISAQKSWSNALLEDPSFVMALGKRLPHG